MISVCCFILLSFLFHSSPTLFSCLSSWLSLLWHTSQSLLHKKKWWLKPHHWFFEEERGVFWCTCKMRRYQIEIGICLSHRKNCKSLSRNFTSFKRNKVHLWAKLSVSISPKATQMELLSHAVHIIICSLPIKSHCKIKTPVLALNTWAVQKQGGKPEGCFIQNMPWDNPCVTTGNDTRSSGGWRHFCLRKAE